MKVLILHGNRQTHDVLSTRMVALLKKLKKAPLSCTFSTSSPTTNGAIEYPLNPGDDVATRGWWAHDASFSHLDQAFSSLVSLINSERFDGIIGFSQGAKLAYLLSSHPDRASLMPSLSFVILASCYDTHHPSTPVVSFPAPPPSSISLPSLHIIGETDKLIPPSSSLAVAGTFQSPVVHMHKGGHHVPMRAADLNVMVGFVAAAQAAGAQAAAPPPAPSPAPAPAPPPAPPMDPADHEAQSDEIEALQSIFFEDDELIVLSPLSPSLASTPAVLQVQAFTFLSTPVYLHVTLLSTYPSASPPRLSVRHSLSGMEFPSRLERAVLRAARASCEEELGNPSVMGAVYAVREWEEDGGVDRALEDTGIADEEEEGGGEGEEEEDAPAAVSSAEFVPFSETSSFDRPDLLDAEALGLSLACASLASPPAADSPAPDFSRGGSLNVVVGLVGKPSAGKSTFFNAATAFSRQSGGGEGAKVGAAPFTTIDPNLGWAFVPIPDGRDVGSGGADGVGSEFGRDAAGRRLLPVLVKDVAGLVPGASAGRGTGNLGRPSAATRGGGGGARGASEASKGGRAKGGERGEQRGASEAKRSEAKRSEAKRSEAKRSEAKRSEARRSEAGQGERSEAKRSEAKRGEARRARALRSPRILASFSSVACLACLACLASLRSPPLASLAPPPTHTRGPQFLDDLTEACALVQITDASGLSDVNGNVLDEVEVSVSDSPVSDVSWIRRELVMWIVNNVLPKFPTVVRRGRGRLHELFTGYRQGRDVLERVLDTLAGDGDETALFETWGRVNVHKLVSCYLAFRFPSVVCLNKMDKPGATERIRDVEASLPVHGCFDCAGVCANAEMDAVKCAIEGAPAVSSDDGVWNVLSKTLALTSAVFVYPVQDLATCASVPVKRVGGGGDVTENHVKSIVARGGVLGRDCPGKCEVCLIMKDGSTVEDLFE
jgi:ribosome-binding ATPase YchF (GTP1/OBG family)